MLNPVGSYTVNETVLDEPSGKVPVAVQVHACCGAFPMMAVAPEALPPEGKDIEPVELTAQLAVGDPLKLIKTCSPMPRSKRVSAEADDTMVECSKVGMVRDPAAEVGWGSGDVMPEVSAYMMLV